MDYFNNLMDDMKEALVLSNERKGLFLPAILVNIVIFVLAIAVIIGVIAITISIISSATTIDTPNAGFGMILGMIIVPILLILFFGILFALIFMIIDIGITGMVIGTLDGDKPSGAQFWGAVKEHLLSVLFTKIGFGLLILVTMVLWIIPWLLYTLTVGVLTGGWGMIFLSCVIQTLVGFWVLIKVEDQRGGFESIGINISFGRKHLWLMVLIFFIQMNLAAFLPGLLGIIGAAIASLFISYVVSTYFKIVLLKTYRRYRDGNMTEIY